MYLQCTAIALFPVLRWTQSNSSIRSIIWTGFSGHDWDDQSWYCNSVIVLDEEDFCEKNLIIQAFCNNLTTSFLLVTFIMRLIKTLFSGSSDTSSTEKLPNVMLSSLFGQYLNEASCMKTCFNMLHKFHVYSNLFVFL